MKKDIIKAIIQMVIAALTALLTSLGVVSCLCICPSTPSLSREGMGVGLCLPLSAPPSE